jgi:MFS transporter, MHS family, alpha-ketoglutarate permease
LQCPCGQEQTALDGVEALAFNVQCIGLEGAPPTSRVEPYDLTSKSDSFADARRRLKAIFIGSVGNLVEWYDFYAYAAFALYFAGDFFPNSDPVVQQLNAALLFAAGFIVRPLGGWMFGYLADHYGRRGALMLSVSLMCFGSLMIAVTPTYETIGLGAPIVLGLARVIQGLSLGGEYGTSATYLTEMADQRNRGFYSSFQYVTLIGGQICALLVLLLLQRVFLSAEEIRAWGWRIPFFIGALLAAIALVMRRNLHETEAFEAAQAAQKVVGRTSSLRALMRYPREVLLVVGLTAGGTAAFYTYTTYMQKFLKLSVGLTDDQTTMVTLSALIFGIVLQPIYGAISDRIGRKWLLIGFGVTGVLFTIPLLTSLQAASGALEAFLLIAAAWMIVSGYTSINAVVKAELFPTNIRAIGVGLPYALTVSIFGGTADSVALTFKSLGREEWFYYYLTGMIGISLVVYLFMRDTKTDSAMHRHE